MSADADHDCHRKEQPAGQSETNADQKKPEKGSRDASQHQPDGAKEPPMLLNAGVVQMPPASHVTTHNGSSIRRCSHRLRTTWRVLRQRRAHRDGCRRTSYLNTMLTVQEAADIVRLTQWAIYRAIARGDLVAYKPGGRLRIDEADLQSWLDATRVAPAKRAPPRPAQPTVPPPALVGAASRRSADGTLRARVRANRRKQSAV
jgi:excisionase family DNA binding protein